MDAGEGELESLEGDEVDDHDSNTTRSAASVGARWSASSRASIINDALQQLSGKPLAPFRFKLAARQRIPDRGSDSEILQEASYRACCCSLQQAVRWRRHCRDQPSTACRSPRHAGRGPPGQGRWISTLVSLTSLLEGISEVGPVIEGGTPTGGNSHGL
ncbi:hypothetical protein FH972_021685 [Carpinus fangiana]|uniref:Uncharacterized protein n=1 Tax=Carpinus fangiana TaxID=176857 RepID=A0A5N6KQE2_9ROSI|nr:hypothetical protein FH972_021685 [Carpinus fangiana]